MRNRIIYLLVILGIAISGCGSDIADFVVTNSQASQPTPVMVARLYLGGDVANATLRVEDAGGQVLASGTTNRNGMVYFENFVAPSDFRLVASLPDFGGEFRAELRDFDQTNRQARVSLLSTLVSLYLESHPDLSLAEAERQIKLATSIPEGVDLNIGLDEPNPSFSDIALLRAAGANGGWGAHSQSVLSQAEAGTGRRYLLSVDQLDRPLLGLEDGLSAVAEASRVRLQKRLRIPDATTDQLAIRHTPSISLIAGPASLGGQFLLGIGTGVGGNVASAGLNAVFGWAANQMGLNYGTSGQLSEIEGQLTNLTGLVTGLVTTINDTNLANQVTEAKNLLAGVRSANTSMLTNLGTANITNQPFSPPPSFASLVSDINAVDYPTTLSQVNNYLVGSSQIIKLAQSILLNQLTGIDGPNSMQNYPWRSNHLLDQLDPLYTDFAGQQTMALNLYAEQAHNYQLNPNPVLGVANMLPNFATAVGNLKTQRQQLPFYMSQWGTIVDYENGVMWMEFVYDPVTYNNAASAAASASIQLVLPDGSTVTYDDWRLPTYGEYISLQNRGKYNPTYASGVPVNSTDSYPDTGQATAGLPGLGFQSVADALNAAPNDNGSNGDMWMSYYSISKTNDTTQWEYRLNHANQNLNYENKSSDTNVYMLCRTFGPDVLVSAYVPGNSGWDNPATTQPSGIAGPSFSAGEIAQFGVPTGITLSTTAAPATVSYPDATDPAQTDTFTVPSGSIQAVANVTYALNLGGNFTMGYGTTQSFSTPAKSHSASVSTASAGNGNPNMIRELINWQSSNDNSLRMLNLPYVSGIAIPLSTNPVTITASLLGAGGVAVTGNLNVTPTAVSPHTLTSIAISPRNQIYGAVSTQPSSGNFPYYCTGFYADGTMETLALDVTWSVEANPANAQIVANASGVDLSMSQPAQATPVAYNVTISASYQGFSDSTTIQIVPPVTP